MGSGRNQDPRQRGTHDGGGFRVWWPALIGSDDTLDNAYLMRMAVALADAFAAMLKPMVFPSSVGKTRRYEPVPQGLKAITALAVLRDKAIKPLQNRRINIDNCFVALRP